MARVPNGIPGEFIGTTGNVSGYMRHERDMETTSCSAAEGNPAMLWRLKVAWFQESKEAVYEISQATRKDSTALLQMNLKKDIAKTWMGFVSADETNAADSVYTGSLNL